jgi:WD40 repeat protein
LRGHTDHVNSVVFSPNDNRLYSTCFDGWVKAWDATLGQEPFQFKRHGARVDCARFSPDGKLVASGGYDQAVLLWNAVSGEVYHRWEGFEKTVTEVAFSPDGRLLAVATGEFGGGEVRVFDIESGAAVERFAGIKGGQCVQFSRDGTKLFCSVSEEGKANQVKSWDVATGDELLTYIGEYGGVADSLSLSPDGRLLVASQARDAYVWEVATGERIGKLTGHENTLNCVAFSNSGKWIVTGSTDATLILWDAETLEHVHEFTGHPSTVNAVAFSPDDSRIVSGGHDFTVRMWDTSNRQELLALRGHGGVILDVAFSPDGNQLTSTSVDGIVRMWDARPWTVVSHVDYEARSVLIRLVERNIPKSEWRQTIMEDPSLAGGVRECALKMIDAWP